MPKQSLVEADRCGASRDDQIANALRNSKIIALVISESTLKGIDDFTEGTGEGVKRLFWQYEMALEIYEHSAERETVILPIFCGDKKKQGHFAAIGLDPHEWLSRDEPSQATTSRFNPFGLKALRLLREDSAMA